MISVVQMENFSFSCCAASSSGLGPCLPLIIFWLCPPGRCRPLPQLPSLPPSTLYPLARLVFLLEPCDIPHLCSLPLQPGGQLAFGAHVTVIISGQGFYCKTQGMPHLRIQALWFHLKKEIHADGKDSNNK